MNQPVRVYRKGDGIPIEIRVRQPKAADKKAPRHDKKPAPKREERQG